MHKEFSKVGSIYAWETIPLAVAIDAEPWNDDLCSAVALVDCEGQFLPYCHTVHDEDYIQLYKSLASFLSNMSAAHFIFNDEDDFCILLKLIYEAFLDGLMDVKRSSIPMSFEIRGFDIKQNQTSHVLWRAEALALAYNRIAEGKI